MVPSDTEREKVRVASNLLTVVKPTRFDGERDKLRVSVRFISVNVYYIGLFNIFTKTYNEGPVLSLIAFAAPALSLSSFVRKVHQFPSASLIELAFALLE